MKATKQKRVLLAKPGFDGHDRGVGVIMLTLRDAGLEVIYTGLHQSPEAIVKTAIQEDVDAIGLSFMNNTQMYICPRVLDLLKQEGANIPVVAGGLITDEDADSLKQRGIAAVFGIGTKLDDVSRYFMNL